MSPRTPGLARHAAHAARRRSRSRHWRDRRTLAIFGAAVGTAVIAVGGAFAIVPSANPAADLAAEHAVAPRPALAQPPAVPVTAPTEITEGAERTERAAKPTQPPRPTPAKRTAAPAVKPKQAAGKQLRIDLTGYSWQDNTPAGSAEVSHPILHRTAGGQGTFADPITVAVPSGKGYQPGTRFYLPTVKRYVIVEDSGASSGSAGTDGHLDMWVDGRDGSAQAVESCMDKITGAVPAELDPPAGRAVIAGPIYSGRACRIPNA